MNDWLQRTATPSVAARLSFLNRLSNRPFQVKHFCDCAVKAVQRMPIRSSGGAHPPRRRGRTEKHLHSAVRHPRLPFPGTANMLEELIVRLETGPSSLDLPDLRP